MKLESIKSRVKHLIGENIVNDMISHLTNSTISLWGENQICHYRENWLYFVLYRDIEDCPIYAYNDIEELSTVGHTSIRHNVDSIRNELFEWAQRHIVLGNQNSWNAVLRGVKFPAGLEAVNLWVDSVDFPIEARKGDVSRKDDYSYKLGTTGARFMTIQDGRGVIVKLWGNYSPKWYDSHYLNAFDSFFRESMYGAHICGDNHFSTALKDIHGVHMYTNRVIQDSSKEKRKHGAQSGDTPTTLRKADQDWNKKHQVVRSRVETPYGHVTNLFSSLRVKWRDTKQQLKNLIYYAFAIHNMIRIQNA